MADLSTYDAVVLEVFLATAMALWTGGMVGAAHVPRHELEVEARARGFELSEHFLKKYAVCERAFAAALRKHQPEKSDNGE